MNDLLESTTRVGRHGIVLVLAFWPMWPAQAADPQAEQETIEIRGQRMPVWPVADLRERGFDVSDLPRDENAAWVYIQAANTYLDLPENLERAFDYAVSKGWPEEQPELKEWLTSKENREAIELARRASRMERCQMPVGGSPDESVISILLPNLSHYRPLAKMLVADGRRLAAEKDYRGAMENLTAAMRMGHHVGQGMTLIESLVGVACWAVGNQAARDLVLRCDLPPAEVTVVSEQWRKLAPLVPIVERGFGHERHFGLTIVDEVVSNPSRLIQSLQGMWNDGWISGPVRPKDGWDRLEARLGHVFLPDRTIKRHMRDYYDTLVETARLPYHDERVVNFDEEKHVMEIPRWDILARALIPSLSRARMLGVRCRTETRVTTMALALKVYASAHEGQYPAALGDLSEGTQADDLIDPFGGGPFHYTRTRDGWTLYSVGPNRTDDGGQTGERWDTPDTDMVYVFPPEPVGPFNPEE